MVSSPEADGVAGAGSVGGIIRTVTGDISAAEIGATLIHEHVVCDLSFRWGDDGPPELTASPVGLANLQAVRRNPRNNRDNLILGDLDMATAELERFAAVGGRTIVEVSCLGIGRDVRALAHVARRSGVNLVAGSGYYVRGSHPYGLGERDESAIADEMIHELTIEVPGTGIRTGVLGELAADVFPIDPVERTVLRAAARAQATTGAAIVVHPGPGTESAFEVLAVLEEAGALLDKVVIAHLDDRFGDDLGLFRRLGASGCRFGFDTFGRETYNQPRGRHAPNDSVRVAAVLGLWDAGLGERITLAHDICTKGDLAAFGGQGYDHLLVEILPRFRRAGLDEAAIEQMLFRTPAEILALPA